jgi:hypothetical protein
MGISSRSWDEQIFYEWVLVVRRFGIKSIKSIIKCFGFFVNRFNMDRIIKKKERLCIIGQLCFEIYFEF